MNVAKKINKNLNIDSYKSRLLIIAFRGNIDRCLGIIMNNRFIRIKNIKDILFDHRGFYNDLYF